MVPHKGRRGQGIWGLGPEHQTQFLVEAALDGQFISLTCKGEYDI